MQLKMHLRSAIGSAIVAALLAQNGTASAQTATGATPSTVSIAGSVVDQIGGLPVASASVELDRDTTKVATTKTDRSGTFVFTGQPPGIYSLLVVSNGYQSARSESVVTVAGRTSTVTLGVTRATVSGGGLHEIGRVSVSGRGALQTSATISRDVSPELLQRENYLRVGDALQALPGVALHNTSSSRGDDLYIDIRGLRESESQVLLDGHPIGPIGATGTQFGRFDAYDFQNSPSFALRNVETTYGSGALGLYGSDAIGGTIDLQTLNPTRTPELVLKQGVGDQGTLSSIFQTTGTIGKLGYAALHGVQGTYGLFEPSNIHQSGDSFGDFTSQTGAGLSYTVGSQFAVRNDLLKLQYAISPATSLTLTGYSATSADDKTGNGDNDFLTYDAALAQAPLGSAITGGGPNGTNVDCSATPALVPAFTDANPNGTCITAAQYAKLASGPQGGGPNAYQTIRDTDLHARLTTRLGSNNFVFDGFSQSYGLDYTRQPSQLNGPLNLQTGIFRTTGFLVSDEMTSRNNDFGIGYYTQQHRARFAQTVTDKTTNVTSLVPAQDGTRYNNSYFIRDVYDATPKVQLLLNAWYRVTTLRHANSFDPRLSVVFRPTGSDVFRFTAGKSDGEPSPASNSLRLSAPGALNPNCNDTTFQIGSAANPNLTPEVASDLEIAYGHRFYADTAINAVVYDTQERDRIEAFAVPAIGYLNQFNPLPYVNRINGACGSSTLSTDPSAPNYFGNTLLVTNAVNVSKARARGIEINGRLRATKNLFFDAVYDVQQTNVFDVPDSILSAGGSNKFVINGAQVREVPLHRANFAVDYTNAHGFEGRLDGFYTGVGNALNRPGYTYFNASFNQDISSTTSLNLGFQNLFDSNVDRYGRFGAGIFIPENRFGKDGGDAIVQQSERFGLTPLTFTFTLTQRIRY